MVENMSETLTVQKLKKINSIISSMTKKLKPDNSILKEVDNSVLSINKMLSQSRIGAECVKGGSIAKNTFLKNDHDIDLFVRFALKYKGKNISDILEPILSKAFPKITISKIHGSRDYFQFSKNSLEYEIIPVLKIHASNYADAENVTDLSPEHVAWVESYTSKNPSLNDEIRVTKQFMKANNVYGAESYINGFSGHIVDILIIHYGSFLSLIKKFASLEKPSSKNPIIIDHEQNMKNPLKELNQSKISPLIIIDPIQKDRNAAAALNAEKLSLFIDTCKNFLETPTEDLFKINKFDLENHIKVIINNLKKGNEKSSIRKFQIILIELYPHESSKDIMGTKIYKTYEDIKKQLILNGFTVMGDIWHFDATSKSGIICFIFEDKKLSITIEQSGPPLNIIDDVNNFREKHEKTYIRGNRIFSVVERKYVLPEELLKKLFSEDFIKSRMKRISMKASKVL